jgi:sec-independent protein translocase protein TatA
VFRLGPWEIVLIVVIVIIIFGPKRLPELGKGIGQFFKNFKKSISPDDDNSKKDSEDKS